MTDAQEKFTTAFEKAKQIIEFNALKFPDCFPTISTDIKGVYRKSPKESFSDGFWAGIYVLVYEMSGDTRFRFLAREYIDILYDRLLNSNDSSFAESGFLYVPSCVSAYRIGRIEKAKTAVVMAADILISLYDKKNGAFFVNNNYTTPNRDNPFPLKISAMPNCSVLYWAAEFTGMESYKKAADAVIDFISDRLIMPDGTAYWQYDTDSGISGEGLVCGENSRVIGWALYGLAVKYRHSHEPKVYGKIKSILHKYVPLIEHEDFYALDSTMLASLVCALYEITKHTEDKDFRQYTEFADKILNMLIDMASLSPLRRTDGLLGCSDGMSIFKIPHRNVSTVVGDYFYMEALVRKLKNFESYL